MSLEQHETGSQDLRVHERLDNVYRNHGTYVGDGLWHVKFKTSRVDYDLFYNFVKSKEDMKNKFSLFKPVYLDYYDLSFREEGSELRYTFFGIKG